jgi:hypothetical protein
MSEDGGRRKRADEGGTTNYDDKHIGEGREKEMSGE